MQRDNAGSIQVGDQRDLRTRIVEISLGTLPRMLMAEKGCFCLELTRDNGPLEFDPVRSPRYTLMTLLGLARARQAGLSSSLDIDSLFERTVSMAPDLGVGELGLLLWLAVRLESPHAAEVAAMLDRRVQDADLDALLGMAVSWIIVGTSFYDHSAGRSDSLAARRVVDYFLTKRISPAGLVWHRGRGWRRRFPNFASQIYSVLGLSVRARLRNDERCARQAIALTNNLKRMQRSNGGWPWLYDAVRGIVVEPFEVYSVHQDGMAPMALFELSQATGYDVSEMIDRSMAWLECRNEIQYPMVDENAGFIYRSVRRRKPLDRVAIQWGVFKTYLGLRPDSGDCTQVPGLELNPTCRPYHFGWILEAWTGRS